MSSDFEELKQLANDISKGRKSLVDLYEYGYYRCLEKVNQETSVPIYSVAIQSGGGND